MKLKRIYKYELISPNETISLRKNAKIVHVAAQKNSVCLWAEISIEETRVESRVFKVFATGEDMKHRLGTTLNRLGTAHLQSGLVFHVYEEINNEY